MVNHIRSMSRTAKLKPQKQEPKPEETAKSNIQMLGHLIVETLILLFKLLVIGVVSLVGIFLLMIG